VVLARIDNEHVSRFVSKFFSQYIKNQNILRIPIK
jgi:hypothetical protein